MVSKEHKKLYKSGKNWVVATLFAMTMLGGVFIASPDSLVAHADTTPVATNNENTSLSAQIDTAKVKVNSASTAVDHAQSDVNSTSNALSSANNQLEADLAVQSSATNVVNSASAALTVAQSVADSAQSAVNSASAEADFYQHLYGSTAAIDANTLQVNYDSAVSAATSAATAVSDATNAVTVAQNNLDNLNSITVPDGWISTVRSTNHVFIIFDGDTSKKLSTLGVELAKQNS